MRPTPLTSTVFTLRVSRALPDHGITVEIAAVLVVMPSLLPGEAGPLATALNDAPVVALGVNDAEPLPFCTSVLVPQSKFAQIGPGDGLTVSVNGLLVTFGIGEESVARIVNELTLGVVEAMLIRPALFMLTPEPNEPAIKLKVCGATPLTVSS